MKKTTVVDATAPKHRVNPDLLPLLRPISELRTDPQNARAHDATDLAAVAASYAKHGQNKPLVALDDGTVIAGNGQLVAARDRLKWTHVAVVTFRDRETARAYALADNRTAELSRWDDPVLAAQLEELAGLGQLEDTAFSLDEMMRIAARAAEDVSAAGAEEKPPAPTSGPKVGEVGAGGLDVDNKNHVRMVQLFLNAETHPPFVAKVKALAVAFGVDNVTEVCVRCVEQSYERTQPKVAAE